MFEMLFLISELFSFRLNHQVSFTLGRKIKWFILRTCTIDSWVCFRIALICSLEFVDATNICFCAILEPPDVSLVSRWAAPSLCPKVMRKWSVIQDWKRNGSRTDSCCIPTLALRVSDWSAPCANSNLHFCEPVSIELKETSVVSQFSANCFQKPHMVHVSTEHDFSQYFSCDRDDRFHSCFVILFCRSSVWRWK